MDELPVIAAGMEGQFQDPIRAGIADLAIRGSGCQRSVVCAASPDDELTHTLRVGHAGWILIGEALINVVMAIQDHICVGGIEQIPK